MKKSFKTEQEKGGNPGETGTRCFSGRVRAEVSPIEAYGEALGAEPVGATIVEGQSRKIRRRKESSNFSGWGGRVSKKRVGEARLSVRTGADDALRKRMRAKLGPWGRG